MFTKDDFIYNAQKNVYICPANKEIRYSFDTTENGKTIQVYLACLACKNCTIKSKCTTSRARRIRRWEHEDRLDEMEAKLQSEPDILNLRKSTVEHPFGTIKSWMGATHFQMRRLKNVSTEMSLHVLAYNLKRMINIIGQQALTEAIRT